MWLSGRPIMVRECFVFFIFLGGPGGGEHSTKVNARIMDVGE